MWSSYCLRSRATLEEAITFANTIHNHPEQKACIICNPYTKQYWLISGESEGMPEWLTANIDQVKTFYQNEFRGSDPFGLELLNFHQ
jgi:hypothetical protein